MIQNNLNPNRRFFYRTVDKRSRDKMIHFLTGHFRYSTMNGWNRSTSYACNLKIDRLGLVSETVDKLFDLIQVPEFYDRLHRVIRNFNQRHSYLWQAGWNGRGGGYLVLYQGERRPSQYRSYCTNCGQKNYRSVAETGRRCGVCNEETRVDFIRPPLEITTFPGRSTDMGEDFENWSMYELKQRTALVQDFDRLADEIVTEGLHIADEHTVVEEIIYVPTTQLALA